MAQDPQEIQPNETRHNEATQPLTVKDSENESIEPESQNEKTQPLPKAPGSGAPEWLIAFASQEGRSTAPTRAEEDTREIRVNPAAAPIQAKDETQPIHIAAAASTWSTEEPPSEPILLEETANPPQEPAFPPNKPEENGFSITFAHALDEHAYEQAWQLLQQHSEAPAARAAALRALRSRLDMQSSSQPLWEMYADLNAKDNQPLLADKAEQTARLLYDLSEE